MEQGLERGVGSCWFQEKRAARLPAKTFLEKRPAQPA